jgi:hypothetical protein
LNPTGTAIHINIIMKIQELLETTTPRDKTRKDHNGNFLGYDPERRVWVVIPRYEGIGMIRSGELANGVLTHGTKYPEFSPSAAPKPQQSTISRTSSGPSKVSSWMSDKDREWRGIAKSGFKQGIRNIKGMIGLKGY